MTICRECKHADFGGGIGVCHASVLRAAGVDPVHGRMMSDMFELCRFVNNGNCPKFEPKPPSLWSRLKGWFHA